ncbi:unnamed protein product [Peronospora destructor]|uniref:Cysteine-rich protein n=1 Tax=Peronospora destructor TaxID=86335 RepID=A0AAV0VDY8_9STRA|nr:unnamed protein product [Peronospora destructor]
MVFKLFFFAALGVTLTLADDDSGSLAMSVGTNGATVQATTGSTVFMGTEYNPDKCMLQFLSLKCNDDNCAELNGYQLECVSQGMQNGKEKKMCQCKSEDNEKCQNSVSPNVTSGTVAQFGECNEQSPCADTYGYIATSKEEGPICAEKLHCVKEINTTATKPVSLCHTCMSCIAQNDAADKQLAVAKRFDCASICSKEILSTVKERNAAGVGIADSYTPLASKSGSENVDDGTSGNDSARGTRSSPAAPQVNVAATLLAIVAVALIGAIH